MTGQPIVDSSSAALVLQAYEAVQNVMILGCLSEGVTVYKQQIRAHNLATALVQHARSQRRSAGRIAIVGGGIGGLTLAAALLVLADSDCHVTLFEKCWDLCPLQQGSDTRWLHPRIYDWPAFGSRNPAAGLPVLDWSEGRASDVAKSVLGRFSDYFSFAAARASEPPLTVYLGLTHLSVDPNTLKIEWMGHQGLHQARHFHVGPPSGDTRNYDTIVISTGFGLESNYRSSSSRGLSYWGNDTLGQPELAGGRRMYVVSGCGDGGIIDLCRITIERFRQDTILDELFGRSLNEVESALRDLTNGQGGRISQNVKELLDGADDTLRLQMLNGIDRLRRRLRKDTRAILHVKPKNPINHSIDALFDNNSSFLNRCLLYMLYKAGGFAVRSEDLDRVIVESGVSQADVIRRHGTSKMEDLLSIFAGPSSMKSHLDSLKLKNAQVTQRLWPLGVFPYVGRTEP